jgi:hypothetical protein
MSSFFPIPRQTRREDIAAAAGQVDFAPVAFRAYAAEDVRVLVRRPGDEGFLPLVGGYTVQLTGAPPSFVTVTLARPSLAGEIVRIEGARTPSRTTDVTLAGIIRAVALEGEFDRIAVTQQEHRRDLDDIGSSVQRILGLLTQLFGLLQGGAASGLPSALDLLAALQASANSVPGAPRLSVLLPLDPVAVVAMMVPANVDDPAWRIWHHARNGAPFSPLSNYIAAVLGLSPNDMLLLSTYAVATRSEAATARVTPFGLLGSLSATAAAVPGAPKLSVALPADPVGTLAASIDAQWDSRKRLIWQFARSADPGSPFSDLVKDALGLSSADMLTLDRYALGTPS